MGLYGHPISQEVSCLSARLIQQQQSPNGVLQLSAVALPNLNTVYDDDVLYFVKSCKKLALQNIREYVATYLDHLPMNVHGSYFCECRLYIG